MTDKLREFLAQALRSRVVKPAKEVFTAHSDIKQLINELSQPDSNAIALDQFFQSLVKDHNDNNSERSSRSSQKLQQPNHNSQTMMADSNYIEMDVDMTSPIQVMDYGSEAECVVRKRKIDTNDEHDNDDEQRNKRIKLPSDSSRYS